MKFRVVIVVLEKLDSSMRAIRVVRYLSCRNELSFGGKGQKHSKATLCVLEF